MFASRKISASFCAFLLVVVSFGIAAGDGNLVFRVSDQVTFHDDFEDGNINDWTVFVDPPSTNFFGIMPMDVIGGPFNIPSAKRLYMHTNLICPYNGVAYGYTPLFTLDYQSDYMIYTTFALLDDTNGQFTVFKDGNVWLIIDGMTELKAYDGVGTSYHIETLASQYPYGIEARVHPSSNNYEVYINGALKGTYDFVNNPSPMSRLMMGDWRDDCVSFGEAVWDDIIVSPLAELPWYDDFEDGTIWDWTTATTSMDFFWPEDMGGNYVLKMYYDGIQAYARGYSPFLYFDPSMNYVASFEFMVPDQTNTWFTLIDTKQFELVIASGSELAVSNGDGIQAYVQTLTPLTWHKIDIRVDVTTQTFGLFIFELGNPGLLIPAGIYNFVDDPQVSSTIMFGGNSTILEHPPYSAYGHGEAYWDNIVVSADSDNDGLSDWEEVNIYGTDPLDPDTDCDGLGDGLEVGLAPYDSDPLTTTDPLDDDSDNDGLLDGNEDLNTDGFWNDPINPVETDPNNPDTDGDILTDGLELGLIAPQGFDTASPPWGEDDGYGPDEDPATITDPLNIDTDDDGLPDGWVDYLEPYGQVNLLEFEDIDFDGKRDGNNVRDGISDWDNGNGDGETDASRDDTDEDGISEYDEITIYLTDPLEYDTDEDGLSDGTELGIFGFDRDMSTTTDPLDCDSDDDGIPDGWIDVNDNGIQELGEYEDSNMNGFRSTYEPDPNAFDTDGDGLSDGLEVGLSEPVCDDTGPEFVPDGDGGETTTDPTMQDSDGDSMPDGWTDHNDNGQKDFGEYEDINLNGKREGNNPKDTYSDWLDPVIPGETDPNFADTDEDDLSDFDEIITYGTDPLDFDDDDDTMPDKWELDNNLDPTNDEDKELDPDNDHLVNWMEFSVNTDPHNDDTDGDFIPDGAPPGQVEDKNPANYNIDNTLNNIIDPDVVYIDESFGVSVALDYDTPSDIEPIIETSSILDGNLNFIVKKLKISTQYNLRYTAVVKIKYSDDDLTPLSINEKHLLMYYYDGEMDNNGNPEPHWTLFKHAVLGEDTWREPKYNYVWAVTKRLGDFAIADTTQNDLDGDANEDEGGTDGEELNIAEYDPLIETLCKYDNENDCGPTNPDNEKSEWDLEFDPGGGTEDIVRFAGIELAAGALEEVIVGINHPKVELTGTPPTLIEESVKPPGGPTGGEAISDIKHVAQSFSLNSDIELGALELHLHISDPEGLLVTEIFNDDNDEPGTLIPNGDAYLIDEHDIPDSQGWAYIPFPSPVILQANIKYWIVLKCSGCNDGHYGWDFSEPYQGEDENGKENENSGEGSWSYVHEQNDFLFRIYEGSYPNNPSLNIKHASQDGYIEWSYTGIFRETDEIVTGDPFEEAIDDFIGRFQSECSGGICTATDGIEYLPFVFHSDSYGQLFLDDIYIYTDAKQIPPSNMLLIDEDNDGLSNQVEEEYYGTLPDVADTDKDGLSDGEEVMCVGSDPNLKDSDYDGLWDGWIDDNQNMEYDTGEILGEVGDPGDNCVIENIPGGHGTSPADSDTDGDGLYDGWDDMGNQNRVYDSGELEGEIGDSQQNGLGGHATDPTLADTDGDTLLDKEELDGFWSGYIIKPGGFKYKTNPLNDDTDEDGLLDPDDPIPLDYDMDGDNKINLLQLIDPSSPHYVERLVDPVQNDKNLERHINGDLIVDTDADEDGQDNSDDDDDDNDGMTDTHELTYGWNIGELHPSPNHGWQHFRLYNERYALLIGYDLGWQTGFNKGAWNSLVKLHNVVKSEGYRDDTNQGFNYDTERTILLYYNEEDPANPMGYDPTIVDFQATNTNLDDILDELALLMTKNDFFLFSYIGHGNHITLKEVYNYILYHDSPDIGLQAKFNKINFVRSAIILSACYSGGAIHKYLPTIPDTQTKPVLSSPDRIILTSADHRGDSMIVYFDDHDFDRVSFSDGVSSALSDGENLLNAFFRGRDYEWIDWYTFGIPRGQLYSNPQLDDNGDGLSYENEFIYPYNDNNDPYKRVYDDFSYWIDTKGTPNWGDDEKISFNYDWDDGYLAAVTYI
jgi:hypothetical protein